MMDESEREPEYAEPPEPEQIWNHSYGSGSDKYVAKTTAKQQLGISEKRWKQLDLSKVRTEERVNPHSELHFTVYCLSDLKRLLGLK
jgi:hypothetical protein